MTAPSTRPTPPTAGPRQRSLSPSRAADFKTCPLLYRFRNIDRLPERPTVEQARGSLVHAVLERLFGLPVVDRTPENATGLLPEALRRLTATDPAVAEVLAATPDAERTLLAAANALLAGYFTMEDPRRLAGTERECFVEAEVAGGLVLHGYIDRLDVAPSGELRVVDYKTGGAPREAFEARALFQLRFYALVLWRGRGVLPRVLRLMYLKDVQICDFTPDADDLERFERTLVALRQAIDRATADRDFRPSAGRLCDWCSHQAHCPAHGGQLPPFPADQ
ncbi:MAG: PD-(D/E)XK nuclease family protein [Dactylosporangium sp.]|nr:PD-(D/E)XK nuclease family protein [Dactylosporangium sp.]NNJ63468.1 PD-(D/E)XK nuclease family protein [Dactylosporangium sp.]